MARPRQFFSVRVTDAKKNQLRIACHTLLYNFQGLDFASMFYPIEPSVIRDLMNDFLYRRGYNNSKLSTILNHKAYYARKQHLIFVLCKIFGIKGEPK